MWLSVLKELTQVAREAQSITEDYLTLFSEIE